MAALGVGNALGNALAKASAPKRGESVYVIPGTHTWICPAGVSSVSVVCVGGGGGGGYGSGGGNCGGGGGALAYINNYPVTPGNTYTVVVGEGGKPQIINNKTGPTFTSATDGGTSYFVSTSVCAAGGGQAGKGNISGAVTPSNGGTVLAGTGFSGGLSGGTFGGASNVGGGGGGAGGYSGAGGSTAHWNGNTVSLTAVAPTGGAGSYGAFYSQSGGATGGCGGGGGVGLYGEGLSGTVPSVGSGTGGGGGSNGQNGGTRISPSLQEATAGNGGMFGGGGGASSYSTTVSYATKGGEGGNGAVRIVWPGDSRKFPSTDVGTPY